MQNTFFSPIMRLGANAASQGTAHFTSVNQTREYNPDNINPTTLSVKALIRRSTRVHVEFTKDAWKQFVALKGNIFTALIQAITVKADMALYITAHEEKGIRLDNLCQEVCYEQGVFFTRAARRCFSGPGSSVAAMCWQPECCSAGAG